MKRTITLVFAFLALLVLASCRVVVKEDAASPAVLEKTEQAPTKEVAQNKPGVLTQQPAAGPEGQYCLGISNGLLFRFVSKDWSGYEIPLSVNYTSSNSGNIYSSGVSTGFGLVIPVKIIGGLHVNLIPEITGGYNHTFSNTNNTEYNSVTKLDESVNLKDFGYTISAGAVCKLEVEYFLNNMISFLPGNISIGGNVAFSYTGNYAENSNQIYDTHINEVTGTHTTYFGSVGALALNGTTLSTLVVRYYF